jgi:hypothetical protein
MMPPPCRRLGGRGWTILEIVFCVQKQDLGRLDKLSPYAAPKVHNGRGLQQNQALMVQPIGKIGTGLAPEFLGLVH